MPPFSNIDSAFNYQLLNQAGSFWNKRVQPKLQVLLLINLATRNSMFGQLRQLINSLAGANRTPEQYVQLQFNPKSVFRTGSLTYDSATDGQTYQDDVNTHLVYNRRHLDYFGIPLTTHIPRCIQAGSQQLVLGLDFFVTSDYLLFRKDPRKVFPNGKFTCNLADRIQPQSPMDYLLRCKVKNDQGFITQYYRGKQSVDAFRLALAAVAGLAITHYTQKLIAVRQQGAQCIYTFEYETLRTNYPHTLLTVGQVYPYYTVIGNGIQFFRDDGTGVKDWWRQVSWNGGLWLSPYVRQFPGLFLNDQDTIVYSAGSDAGSTSGNRCHARIQLGADFSVEQPYWDWVGQNETSTGNYINNLPMAQLPDDAAPTLSLTFSGTSPNKTLTGVTCSGISGVYLTVPTYTINSSLGSAVLQFTLDAHGHIALVTVTSSNALWAAGDSITLSSPDITPFADLVNRNTAANVQNQQYGWPLEQPDLESLTNRKLVNALDFFFGAVWQKRGLIISVDHTQICDLANFYRFMQREMPSGIIPIVLSYGAAASEAFTSTVFVDSATITAGGVLTPDPDTITLSVVMSDAGSTVG